MIVKSNESFDLVCCWLIWQSGKNCGKPLYLFFWSRSPQGRNGQWQCSSVSRSITSLRKLSAAIDPWVVDPYEHRGRCISGFPTRYITRTGCWLKFGNGFEMLPFSRPSTFERLGFWRTQQRQIHARHLHVNGDQHKTCVNDLVLFSSTYRIERAGALEALFFLAGRAQSYFFSST